MDFAKVIFDEVSNSRIFYYNKKYSIHITIRKKKHIDLLENKWKINSIFLWRTFLPEKNKNKLQREISNLKSLSESCSKKQICTFLSLRDMWPCFRLYKSNSSNPMTFIGKFPNKTQNTQKKCFLADLRNVSCYEGTNATKS